MGVFWTISPVWKSIKSRKFYFGLADSPDMITGKIGKPILLQYPLSSSEEH
jgi:hypothetical protein